MANMTTSRHVNKHPWCVCVCLQSNGTLTRCQCSIALYTHTHTHCHERPVRKQGLVHDRACTYASAHDSMNYLLNYTRCWGAGRDQRVSVESLSIARESRALFLFSKTPALRPEE